MIECLVKRQRAERREKQKSNRHHLGSIFGVKIMKKRLFWWTFLMEKSDVDMPRIGPFPCLWWSFFSDLYAGKFWPIIYMRCGCVPILINRHIHQWRKMNYGILTCFDVYLPPKVDLFYLPTQEPFESSLLGPGLVWTWLRRCEVNSVVMNGKLLIVFFPLLSWTWKLFNDWCFSMFLSGICQKLLITYIKYVHS